MQMTDGETEQDGDLEKLVKVSEITDMEGELTEKSNEAIVKVSEITDKDNCEERDLKVDECGADQVRDPGVYDNREELLNEKDAGAASLGGRLVHSTASLI